ncbi:MFS transporter [Streptomyces sp. NPDC004732]|uniref:MFS transporter n=1 Tax=Streptomyces sp. NPDC004732 TaxID=3154290 RepID=UPI0033A2E868
MPSPSPASGSVLRDRDFRLLWVGQAASQFGAQAGLVVLPLIAVVTLDASTGRLGALRAVEQAPILLFSLFVGAWVDRRRARDVMVLSDLGRVLALAAVALAYPLGVLGLPALFVVAFVFGVLGVFFDVAYQTCLVRLVTHDQLARGNSALEGSRSAAQIGGPALGGALVSLLSAPVAALASAFFFAVSAVSIRRVRRDEAPPTASTAVAPAASPASSADSSTTPSTAASRKRPVGLWRQIFEGLRLVAGHPALRAVGLASATFQFCFAALMTLYLLYLPRGLQLSGAAVGLALAATGPGAVVGSLLAARLPGRFGYGRVLVASALLGDGVLLCVPALHGSGVVTVCLLMGINLVFGVFSQLVNVTVMAVRQAVTPVGLQGRVVATINFVGMGLTPLGSLLGGFLADELGLRAGLLAAAAGMTLSPVCMALSPLARLGRTLPG